MDEGKPQDTPRLQKKGKKGKKNAPRGEDVESWRPITLPVVATDIHTPRQQSASPGLSASLSREQALRAALTTSVLSGQFIDTKFYAYSRRRTGSGLIDEPRAIYANSVALRRVLPPEDVDKVLPGESELAPNNDDCHTPENASITMRNYAYDSDSDLDDEVDDVGDERSAVHHSLKTSEDATTANTMEVAQDLEVSDAAGDIEMIEDPASLSAVAEPVPSADSAVASTAASAPSSMPAGDSAARVVYIKDIAFKTYQAFICYLYTGQVDFAPLKSQEAHIGKGKVVDHTTWTLHEPLPCSPKSMYRLAEKYGLTDLRKLAGQNLKSKLSRENILAEVFSSFTSRHPDIATTQIEYLCANLDGPVQSALPRWLESVAAGNLPSSGSVLTAIMQKLITFKMAESRGSATSWQCSVCFLSNTTVGCCHCGSSVPFTST